MIELCLQEEAVKAVDALPDGSSAIAVLAVWLGETVAATDFASKG